MGAHESPMAVLTDVETGAIRQRAADLAAVYDELCAAYDSHHDFCCGIPGGREMDRADWLIWEGRAYMRLREGRAILLELVRG